MNHEFKTWLEKGHYIKVNSKHPYRRVEILGNKSSYWFGPILNGNELYNASKI